MLIVLYRLADIYIIKVRRATIEVQLNDEIQLINSISNLKMP